MPTTRRGRQSSPAKEADSPSKRVQPMRGARLRSASPFFDAGSASTSAVASQKSSQASTSAASSPSKSTRASPKKKTASSLQPPLRRSTRSRSRSVDPESLTVIDEDSLLASTREASEELDTDGDLPQSTLPEEESLIRESSLAPVSEEEEAPASIPSEASSSDDEDSSSSSSDSGSDSDDSSGSDSSSDDGEEEDDTTPDLDALLKASQQAFKSRAPAPTAQSRFEDNQDVISFEAVSDNAATSKRSAKPMPLVVKAKHQMAKAHSIPSKAPSSSQAKLDKQIENLDQAPIEADRKKSKHARTVQTSTGSSWFDMPEFGASASRLAALKKQSAVDSGHAKTTGGDARLASAQQLRREVQALRLRNALDPKRFYRGSAKNQAMPKFAQIGKIIASPLEPKAVLSRQERGRTVVEELIRDAEAASYAKRKFAESQASHRSNYNGRRKPPSKKKRT